jgi:hypothetical protein
LGLVRWAGHRCCHGLRLLEVAVSVDVAPAALASTFLTSIVGATSYSLLGLTTDGDEPPVLLIPLGRRRLTASSSMLEHYGGDTDNPQWMFEDTASGAGLM